MNRTVSFYIFRLLGFLILPLLFSVTAVSAETLGGTPPTTLVGEGAHDYALGSRRIYWHTRSFCDIPPGAAPQAPEDPELIQRMYTFGSTVRTLLNKNDPRPVGACNPYHIHSNIVADRTNAYGGYVYWADDSGLVRLSTFANVGDEPELMSDTIISSGNEQRVVLAVNSTHIFAIRYNSNSTSEVWAINKSTLAEELVDDITGIASKLLADETYVYWTTGGTLYRAFDFLAGYMVDSIATNVTAYTTEGERLSCFIVCVLVHHVFIAKGDTVVRYNNLNNTTSGVIYTSTSPDDPNIYSMVVEDGNLFFLESRAYLPCPGCFFEYTQILFRMWEFQTSAVPLHTHISELTGYLDTDHLSSDSDEVYWQQDDMVLKLPHDAESLPLTNIQVTRIEVTQGIQNINNTIPLIKGRRTIVRAFAQAAGENVSGVTAFLYRVDPITQQPISAALAPVNTIGTHLTVFASPNPALLDSSFNFELPLAWVQEGVPLRFKVVVNPYNTPLEINPNDNTIMSPAFIPVHSSRLEVEFYSFSYNDANNLWHYPRPIEDEQQTFSWIRRTYPLASTPGSGVDASPGFRPNLHYVHMSELYALVTQTHEFCQEFDADERSLCASTYVNDKLRAWQEADEDADGTAYIYYGWIPDDSGFPRGRGGDGVASGPTGPTGGWDMDGTYADWYTAHELGHAIGRNHPSQGNWCGHSDDDDDYPHMDTAIGPYNGGGVEQGQVWGFDMGDIPMGIPMQVNPSAIWRDVMGYCDFQWISDYTYQGLYGDIPEWEDGVLLNQIPTFAGNDTLAVYGTLFPNGSAAYLTHLQRTPANTVPPLVPGPFAIRLLNAQNQVLADYAFTPDEPEEGSATQSFGQMVTFVAGTTQVQIVELATNAIWAAQAISANVPVVSNVNLSNATPPITGMATINWAAVDADGDTLTFDVFFSQDGGAIFKPFMMGLSGNSTEADTDFLGGGPTIFRVVASDGAQTGSADSAPYTLANKPPQPRIHNPGDGTVIQWGQLINFIGEAWDLQDGTVAAANLVWSNQNGVLGTGPVLTSTDLPVGVNLITLTATNSEGETATTSITVVVKDEVQFPGPTLAASPTPIGWHVAAGETADQTTTLHIYNIGDGDLDWTAESSAEWLTLGTSTGTNSMAVMVTADLTGMTAPSTRQATITITAEVENGPTQVVTVPVTLSMGNIWVTGGNTFKVYLPVVIR